ncbi:dihydroxyacetone kinase subunit DhaL [uncultured Jatrophihabitans sp.]|uniref:dihydroxyacetone kinase subunit DhaL n=1 Tax=uncultured Jatrophihabitans sp. TaxID=1610747 RepID=UPI0035CB36DF
MAVDAGTVRDWLERFTASVRDAQEELTALDSAIGDADHALNLLRGLDAAREAAATVDSPGLALRKAGRAFVSYAGGATGPLWGTLLMRTGSALEPSPVVDSANFVYALRAGVTGLAERGRCKVGDGTMLDALVPAVEALERNPADWAAASAAAAAGRDSTGDLVPRRGRAGYLGDRAIGHVDPGAASAALLIAALADVLTQSRIVESP